MTDLPAEIARQPCDSAPHPEYRFLLRCSTASPLSVSAGAASQHTDNDLRRSATGKVVIPGTSIAGALRGAVERMAAVECMTKCRFWSNDDDAAGPCGCAVCGLFGDMHPVTEQAAASKVWVADAIFPVDPEERIVDSVALHRNRRSAADARRFDSAEIVQRQIFWLEIRAGGTRPHERLTVQELSWLGAAIRLLGEGFVALGGQTRRGSGRIQVDGAWLRARDLSKCDQLVAAVTFNAWNPRDNGSEWPANDPVWPEVVSCELESFPGKSESQKFRDSWTRLEFSLCPNQQTGGTFLINDAEASFRSGFDRAPRGGVEHPELPARSLRGVLRSGCERIARTIACSVAGDDELICDAVACDPAFTHCNASTTCLICRLFGNSHAAGPLTVRVATAKGESTAAPQDHVAIDRFTGGARDQLKFDAQAAHGNLLYEVELLLDVVDKSDRLWMIGLLMLALGDIHRGKLSIGHGAAKGHGFWSVTPPDMRFLDVKLDDAVKTVWRTIEKILKSNIEHIEKPVGKGGAE